ncbi:hypothetical protein ACMFMG_010551 [Clarireedia jacksonii]
MSVERILISYSCNVCQSRDVASNMISRIAFEGRATKFIPILAQNGLQSFGQPCDKNPWKTRQLHGPVKVSSCKQKWETRAKSKSNPCTKVFDEHKKDDKEYGVEVQMAWIASLDPSSELTLPSPNLC